MSTNRMSVRRRGHTLLELIAASTIISIAITSTLSLMVDSLEVSRDLEQRNLVTTLAVSKLEEHASLVTSSFTEGTFSGNFSAEGQPSIRFNVTRSTDPAVGGVLSELMVVSVYVWQDADGNGARNGSEPNVSLTTKIANLTAWKL